jgi:hypothetical protein
LLIDDAPGSEASRFFLPLPPFRIFVVTTRPLPLFNRLHFPGAVVSLDIQVVPVTTGLRLSGVSSEKKVKDELPPTDLLTPPCLT